MIGEAIQALKRAFGKRGPVFEVQQNRAGHYFVHLRSANGQIVNVGEAYSSRSNAIRAAKTQAGRTVDATWRVIRS